MLNGPLRPARAGSVGSQMSPPRARTLTQIAALVEAGLVAPERRDALEAVAARYAVAIPPALAALIDPADPADPIARQFSPDTRELERRPEELDDPIGDDLKSPVAGLVHRYPDRVLLKLASVCAVYCRFCFRRESVGPGEPGLDEAGLAAAVAYIAARPQIWEAIFTGGDPLALSARRVAAATQAVAAVGHVKVLRWHTRLPVAAPERVTPALAKALTAGHDKTVYVALHANHPRELTREARAACRGAGEALLPPPRRSRAGHVASAHLDPRGAGADARAAPARLRPRHAGLYARHPRRQGQGAFGPGLCPRGRGGRL